jgi:hypothetical protein
MKIRINNAKVRTSPPVRYYFKSQVFPGHWYPCTMNVPFNGSFYGSFSVTYFDGAISVEHNRICTSHFPDKSEVDPVVLENPVTLDYKQAFELYNSFKE